jgi:integrase
MINLPNGCSRSNITVSPSNWKSNKQSMQKHWVISYRFYNQQGVRKQVHIRGMNDVTSWEARKKETQQLIEAEINLLDHKGYNPISKSYELLPADGIISPASYFCDALNLAYEQLVCSVHMKECVKSCVGIIRNAAAVLSLGNVNINTIRSRHILLVLNTCEKQRKLSAQSFNHYRSYLLQLFKVLVLAGAIEYNPVKDVPRRKVMKKIKLTLTREQRPVVNKFLLANHYTFWRYMQIFFHSGARSTELLSIKVRHVNLVEQKYRCLVNKGSSGFETMKTIKDIALPLWQELLKDAHPDDYVFSKHLKPGPVMIRAEQITKRWSKYIKNPKGIHLKRWEEVAGKDMKIDSDFYKLKHLHTTEVLDIMEREEQGNQRTALNDIAEWNSHTSDAMVVKIYDTKQEQRRHKKVKGIVNPLA